jgi:hypothetical protein
MHTHTLTKTASRSVLGTMNDFTILASVARQHGQAEDLHTLSVELADTPCGPRYKSHISPDRELAALIAASQPGRQ